MKFQEVRLSYPHGEARPQHWLRPAGVGGCVTVTHCQVPWTGESVRVLFGARATAYDLPRCEVCRLALAEYLWGPEPQERSLFDEQA